MKNISIITINYNNASGLARTIESVINQSDINYEYILIDGGSTDTSKQIIEQYSSKLDFWISEKDNGIYHAMNKGIRQAHGKYLLFLNSGDYLEPDILKEIEKELTGEDIIYGDLYFIIKEERYLVEYPQILTASHLISPGFSLPHPASFIKKELFSDTLYNENYKIVSDWEFFIKSIIFRNCTTKHLNIGISNYLDGGISSNELELCDKERKRVLDELFPAKIQNDLQRLFQLEQSPLCEVISKTYSTRKFQKRAKKLILFLYKINNLFHK